MLFNNKKFMYSYVTLKQTELNIHCNDLEMKQKIEQISNIMDNNLKQGWSKSDYINFFKQFSKLNVEAFNDSYYAMTELLTLPLEEIKERLIYLDNALNLQMFEDERHVEQVQVGNSYTTSIKYTPHEFSTTDIVILFQRLYSEINKHCGIGYNAYKNIINQCTSLEDKKHEAKVFLELLRDKDSDICNSVIQSYLEWISVLPKDDSIYKYLETRIPKVISLIQQHIKSDLKEYDSNLELFNYKKSKISELKNKEAKEKQKHVGYRSHSVF